MESSTAKEFLISKVVEEAKTEGIPLSEIERKMLYFTESYPTPFDIYEVNEEFERSYDNDEYETKVAGLLARARGRDKKAALGEEERWQEALNALKKEDHYILVMVRQAFRLGSSRTKQSRLRDFLIYIAVGLGVVVILLIIMARNLGH